MWIKRRLPLLLVLFWCLSCASQSWAQSTTATWDDFDETLMQLEAEISNLKQNLLTIEQALTASDSELQTVKRQSQEQQALLKKYQDSLKRSEQSLTTCEQSLRAAERLNIILIITQVMSLIGIGALVL